VLNIAVEGESDREAARAVVAAAGHDVRKIVVAGGNTKLDPKIPKYNQAAVYGPGWVVFRDADADCPVELRGQLTAGMESGERFQLRIAKSMTEAWLLADREGFAEYFKVRVKTVPVDPESLPHAKRTVLDIVGRYAAKSVRGDVVTSSGETGPLYVYRINEFARDHWDVTAAAERSPSLARALLQISGMLDG